MSNMEIKSLPDQFLDGLTNLTKLDLSSNKFDNVPPQIHYGNGKHLQELILDDNPMEVLKSHSFNEMRNLKRLSIRFMPNLNLVEHAAFATLENLKTLKVSNNPRLHYINSDGFKDFQDPLILR